MKVDVGIVSYNAPYYLYKCLESLVRDKRLNIWVYDNASNAETVDMLKKYNDRHGINLMLSNENRGYAFALNRIIEQTKEKYFVCMNSDIEVLGDWLSPMVEMCEKDKKVGVVQPKMVDQNGLLMGCGVGGTNAKRVIRGWRQKDVGQFNEPLESVAVCGACMLVPRKVFEVVGVFDERFKFYYEETDHNFQMRKAGYKAMYYPASTVIHYWNKSPKENNPLVENAFKDGDKLFNEKHFDMMDDETEY